MFFSYSPPQNHTAIYLLKARCTRSILLTIIMRPSQYIERVYGDVQKFKSSVQCIYIFQNVLKYTDINMSAECHPSTLELCVKFFSTIFYPFWGQKYRIGIFGP